MVGIHSPVIGNIIASASPTSANDNEDEVERSID